MDSFANIAAASQHLSQRGRKKGQQTKREGRTLSRALFLQVAEKRSVFRKKCCTPRRIATQCCDRAPRKTLAKKCGFSSVMSGCLVSFWWVFLRFLFFVLNFQNTPVDPKWVAVVSTRIVAWSQQQLNPTTPRSHSTSTKTTKIVPRKNYLSGCPQTCRFACPLLGIQSKIEIQHIQYPVHKGCLPN